MTGKTGLLQKPRLVVPEFISEQASEFLTTVGLVEGAYIFCFPAGVSNVAVKTWPEGNFGEIVAHLEKRYSLKTVVAGHESEKSIVDRVAESARCHDANPFGMAWKAR